MATPFAISQLAKKLRLENDVAPRLTNFFEELSKTIQPVMNSTGQLPSVTAFRSDLINILSDHYRDTAEAFKGDVSTTKSMELKQEESLDESFNEAIDSLIADRAPKQTEFILGTVDKELRQISDDIIVDAASEGDVLSVEEQSAQVTQEFNALIPAKVNTIATYETQTMAEAAKFTRADVAVSVGVVAATMRKVWNTVLDEATRDSHVLADGQRRRLGQPFRVQGQSLRYPGDTGLGATLDNVIECRCASRYQVGAG